MPPRFFSKTTLLVSLLFLVPCFWQSRIQSIDLSSHIYNSWLASLISQNKAPGLWIEHQSNNVLFDLMLAWLFSRVGVAAAQAIAVGVSVLIFSWGAILLISRLKPQNWWFLLPSVAVLSYGFIFHLGFFNFYLGLGITFWYLAFFLTGRWGIRWSLTPLLLLAWLAHPLPFIWGVGLALYIAVAESIPVHSRVILAAAALVALLGVHFLLLTLYPCISSVNQMWSMTGADQLLLFDRIYAIPYVLLLVAWAMSFRRGLKASGWRNVALDLNFHLWLLTAAAVVMIPSSISFPQYARPFTVITARFSLAAGIMLCAFLINVQPKAHEKVMLSLAAVIFFGLVFRDARKLNRFEDQVDAAVAKVPLRGRVIGMLRAPTDKVIPGLHTLDRACIGRCFSYANYEPSTRQFRIRAASASPIVMADNADVFAVEKGEYRVHARDVPIYLLYLCGEGGQQICSRPLLEGEMIGGVTTTK